jgi:hypothetical protein
MPAPTTYAPKCKTIELGTPVADLPVAEVQEPPIFGSGAYLRYDQSWYDLCREWGYRADPAKSPSPECGVWQALDRPYVNEHCNFQGAVRYCGVYVRDEVVVATRAFCAD